jgi:hypothetical protein
MHEDSQQQCYVCQCNPRAGHTLELTTLADMAISGLSATVLHALRRCLANYEPVVDSSSQDNILQCGEQQAATCATTAGASMIPHLVFRLESCVRCSFYWVAYAPWRQLHARLGHPPVHAPLA